MIAVFCITLLGSLYAADSQELKCISMPELPIAEPDIDEFDKDGYTYTLCTVHSFPALPTRKPNPLNQHPIALELPSDFNNHGACVYSPYKHIEAKPEHADIKIEKEDKQLPFITPPLSPSGNPPIKGYAPVDYRAYWEQRKILQLKREGERKIEQKNQERLIRSAALNRRHNHSK